MFDILGFLSGLWAAIVQFFASVFGGILVVGLVMLAGCGDKAPTVNETLMLLQQGKFAGDLTLTSDGRVSVSETIHLGFGAEGSAVSAHGTVNFADQVRVQDIVAPLSPEGGDTDPSGGG